MLKFPILDTFHTVLWQMTLWCRSALKVVRDCRDVLVLRFLCWRNGSIGNPLPIPLEKFVFKKGNDNVCELKGRRPVNGIASKLPMQRIETFIVFFWQWKWISVVIRLEVPTEMHYTVIPMGTSKVNSSQSTCNTFNMSFTFTKFAWF